MQVSEMKAFRSFYSNKQFFLSNPNKTPKSFLPLSSRQNPQLSRHFRPTPRLSRAEESSVAVESSKGQFHPPPPTSSSDDGPAPGNPRAVWSVFNPLTGKVTIQRGAGEDVKGGASGSGRGRVEVSGGERDYGSVKKENLSQGEASDIGRAGEVEKGKCYSGVKGENLGDSDQPLIKGRSGYVNDKEVGTRYGYVQKGADSGSGFVAKDVLGNKKKGKSKMVYVCASCGDSDGQWWGYCPSCKAPGTMKQFSENGGTGGKVSGFEVSENVVRSWFQHQSGDGRPLRLTDVNRGVNQMEWRISLSGNFGSEVDRVLGGGLVPGSLVLVGGDPGVGKSTLLLQIASALSDGLNVSEPAAVVYISGEESVEQIGNRADRLKISTDNLFLYSSTDIEDILNKVRPLSPRALVIDSIQTVYLKGAVGSAGGINQVKECTSALLRFAKKTNISVFLIGHVNKEGDIAGPRILEHIVDVVLYMEGEKSSFHRLLRPVKNRFGSIDELGVFEMDQSGLQPVLNPSEIFLSEQLSDSEVLTGLAVAVIMDGSRSFLIEIQALCASGSSARHVNGIPASKADMIISVLIKQAGLMLQQNAIFLNVVGGVILKETSGDLAIAAAICSSFLEFPIPNNVAFIGEIGLGGELRPVPRMDKRVNTAAKLGYKKCIIPKSSLKLLEHLGIQGMEVIGCRNLKEVINAVFKTQQR